MVDHRSEWRSVGAGGVRTVVLAAAIVLVVIAGIWLVSRVGPSGERAEGTVAARLSDLVETGEARGFNVLLVTLDTVRADRLGCYG
ncbi:hypothetical protein KAW64_07100, partial [bacterium]|nr:hypothetical protein [bacterium]